MALYQLKAFYPNYRQELFQGSDIKGLPVYAGRTDEKIGTVDTILVDESGHFRYLVIDTGVWIFGKKVLLPMGQCEIDTKSERVYATGLTSKKQAEALPPYDDSMVVDYNYEEQVRTVYRMRPVEESAPVEVSRPVEASRPVEGYPVGASGAVEGYVEAKKSRSPSRPSEQPPVHPPVQPSVPPSPQPQNRTEPEPQLLSVQQPPTFDRNTYTYDLEPNLYKTNEQNHQQFKLYEEQLIAHKNRQKTGEVIISKRVETESKQISVPVEKERVVIERVPVQSTQPVAPSSTHAFQDGEIARIDVYEEAVDIRKQPVLREDVRIRKEVDRDTVTAEDTVRREEIDINKRGNPTVEEFNQH